MDMDRIYAEAIANEYAPKNTSKVMALKKLDRKAKKRGEYLRLYVDAHDMEICTEERGNLFTI